MARKFKLEPYGAGSGYPGWFRVNRSQDGSSYFASTGFSVHKADLPNLFLAVQEALAKEALK